MFKTFASFTHSGASLREEARLMAGVLLLAVAVSLPGVIAFSYGVQPLSEQWVRDNIALR